MYYRFVIIIASILCGYYKIHEMVVSEIMANPIEALVKILGIIVIVAFIITPNEYLQSEDR